MRVCVHASSDPRTLLAEALDRRTRPGIWANLGYCIWAIWDISAIQVISVISVISVIGHLSHLGHLGDLGHLRVL